MISKSERIKLKEILKEPFILEVIGILNKKKIYNKNGKPFSKAYISHVFNGKNANKEIEYAIFEVAEKRKEQQEKLISYKKSVLR